MLQWLTIKLLEVGWCLITITKSRTHENLYSISQNMRIICCSMLWCMLIISISCPEVKIESRWGWPLVVKYLGLSAHQRKGACKLPTAVATCLEFDNKLILSQINDDIQSVWSDLKIQQCHHRFGQYCRTC